MWSSTFDQRGGQEAAVFSGYRQLLSPQKKNRKRLRWGGKSLVQGTGERKEEEGLPAKTRLVRVTCAYIAAHYKRICQRVGKEFCMVKKITREFKQIWTATVTKTKIMIFISTFQWNPTLWTYHRILSVIFFSPSEIGLKIHGWWVVLKSNRN